MLIQHTRLIDFVTEIFAASGVSASSAQAVAHHLVHANLKGHDSHGVGMIPAYYNNLTKGHLSPHADIKILKDKGAVLLIDGQNGFGQVVGKQATNLAIERVKETGIVCMGLRNAHHLGRIGSYGEQCGNAGYGSVSFVNVVGHAPQVVAFGGREPRMTTNPFCCVVPRKDKPPVVLDMATSAVALGKIRVANMKGEQAPDGALVDHEGIPTTDPKVIFQEPRGALGPFGKHKGYGLALICELLGGALAGEWTAQPDNPRAGTIVNNMLMFVFDPDIFDGAQQFSDEVESMLAYIHSSTPARGIDRVRVPGEPEIEAMDARSKTGIDIDQNTWAAICKVANRLKIETENMG